MNQSECLELMHAVLDGEATPQQARDLEHALASDPAARAQFDQLRQLFDGLAAIPQAFPPEGLVAAVLDSAASGPATDNQLSSQPGVIGQTSATSRARRPERSARQQPVSQPRSIFRGENMNEQQSRFPGRRNMWIGGGIAAAAAILLISFGMDIPPSTSDTTGTIVPAQRYRASQNMADGVTGTNSGAQSAQGIPAASSGLAAQAGANAASARATDAATAKAVDAASARATDAATAKAVDAASARATDAATAKAVDAASARATDAATAKAVDAASARATDAATAKAVDAATAKATQNAVQR